MTTYGIGYYGTGTYGSGGLGTPPAYDVTLGPLAFVSPLSPTAEQLGAVLDAVGAVPTPADPRPRPFKLSLPVRGDDKELDARAVGYRLRRQIRQLLENPRWRSHGLYFHFRADTELDGWLLVGGGDLEETDAGITFGDWTLELTDCYLVGRPARHRLGRRLELGDRRSGLVPLDTRGRLYSTDHDDQPLPPQPLVVPGDTAAVLLSRNRQPASLTPGPAFNGRTLWQAVGGAIDGDVASFVPALYELGIVTDPTIEYVELEEPGSIRAWNTADSTLDLDDPTPTYLPLNDEIPTLYGWERLYGDPLTRDAPLAIDNGYCRLVWAAPFAGKPPGLIYEVRDQVSGVYERLGAFRSNESGTTTPAFREVTVIELGPDRAVIEWRAGHISIRAILQRGWLGPRIEAYNDQSTVRLDYAPIAGPLTDGAAQTPTWVKRWDDTDGRGLLWALGRDSDVISTPGSSAFATAGARRLTSPAGVVVGQICRAGDQDADTLASLAVADARSIPVLVTR